MQSLDRFGLPGSLDVRMTWRPVCLASVDAGLLSHRVDFPSNIEITHFRFFTETSRRAPKPYVKEVVLRTDTDPLVEGPDFSVCQQLSP